MATTTFSQEVQVEALIENIALINVIDLMIKYEIGITQHTLPFTIKIVTFKGL